MPDDQEHFISNRALHIILAVLSGLILALLIVAIYLEFA